MVYYEGLTPQLTSVVERLEKGDGIAIKFFRNHPTDKAIGYVDSKGCSTLTLTPERKNLINDRKSLTTYNFIDMESIQVVDPLRNMR